nr:transposase, MuDR, MULE transposase domain protein [Tanacetum cinerariifolium]
MNDHEEIGGGCFGDIESYLKKGKLETVVAIINSCKPNVLGDMNVTLKDPSGTTSGLFCEVTEAVRDKAEVIEEVKELVVRAQSSDRMAYLRILRDEDLAKANDIINLIKETQKHTRGNLYVSDVEVCGDCSMLVSLCFGC